MAAGLEPAFMPGGQVWPLAGMALAAYEPDDPDLAIPRGALQAGMREAAERIRILDQSACLTDTPPEPLRVAATGPAERKRKWTAALVASCIFHAAIALFFIGAASEEALMEGSEQSGIAFLGSAPEDQISAGDPNALAVTMITMLEAKPVETVEAETAPTPDAMQPVEVVEAELLQTETLQPVMDLPLQQAPPDAPTQAAPSERAEPAPAAAAELPPPAMEALRILAADTLQPVEEDQAVPEIAEAAPAEIPETARTPPVAQTAPLDTAERVETVEPVETAALQPTVAEILEPEPDLPVERIPLPTPRPAELVEQARPVKQAAPKPKVAQAEKPAKKPAAKPKARQSGNGGENQADARRGQSDGQADGRAAAKSAGRKNSAAGNAAVSNYPGKVVSKLRRALRYPAAARRQRLRGEAHVQFTVSAGGGVSSARIVKSSGSPVLDAAALETVRRAAPFPAIPPEAARSSWPFTVPLAFTR